MSSDAFSASTSAIFFIKSLAEGNRSAGFVVIIGSLNDHLINNIFASLRRDLIYRNIARPRTRKITAFFGRLRDAQGQEFHRYRSSGREPAASRKDEAQGLRKGVAQASGRVVPAAALGKGNG